MEKIITQIVTRLLSNLSRNKLYHTQKNLTDCNFPDFLIKRITYHLLNELNNQFTLPGEEWVNSDSDELSTKWADLQRTIKNELHLPTYLAEEVVEKSVRECIGMTIQPRKVIPELLFEGHVEMDSNQLTERSSAITVNRFLVWSMLRYMEKKEKESLHFSEAIRIIETIDAKIVENYHPLNWLSLVKPLFELSGTTVHSDLFRRFFEFKGKNPIAKEFDLIDDEIKESRFIEILSSPNSIHVEGYKDDQQALFSEDERVNDAEEDEEMEELSENQNERVADNSDETPIFQSFKKVPDQETEEWIDNREDEQETELEQKFIDEDHQDEEMIAPWDDEDEDSETILAAEELEEDPHSELDDLNIDDDEGIDEPGNETIKKNEPVSDAELLEIDDEEDVENPESEVKTVERNSELESETDEEDLESDLELDAEEIEESDEIESNDESETVIVNMNAELESEEDEEDSSLLNRFMFDDSNEEDSIANKKSDRGKKVATIYDELNLVRNDAKPKTMDLFGTLDTPDLNKPSTDLKKENKKPALETEDSETIQKFSDFDEPESDPESTENDVPMWRSFLERDENEAKSIFQFDDEAVNKNEGLNVEESDETLDEDGFIEEPIYDFTQKEPDLDEKIGDLSDWMQDVRDKFIEDLFGDSEDAYEQALSDIMEFDDWKNASKYIEKEIFTRNRIDIYDEIAVDFTDRLHSYFIEKKS